jgi:hypothetical protein
MSLTSFDLRTSPDQLPNPTGEIQRKVFEKVEPTANITGALFTPGATCRFDYQNSGSKWFCPSESYMNAHITLRKSTGGVIDNATAALEVSYCYDPVASLWSSAQHEINGSVVSRVENYAQTSAVVSRMDSSDQWRSGSGQVEGRQSSRAERFAMTQRAKTTEFTHRPTALSIYRSNDLIPPTCRHSLTFQVASQWEQRIIDAIAANKTFAAFGVATTANNYTVSVDKLEFYACYYEADASMVADSTVYLDLREVTLVTKPINSATETIPYTVRPSCYKLGCFFQDSNARAGTAGRTPPSKFTSQENGTNPVTHQLLTQLQMNFGGTNYPHSPYYLSYLRADNQNGYKRAYSDTLRALGYDEDAWEDFNATWGPDGALGPMYVFSSIRPTDDRSTDVSVQTTFSADPTGLALWVFGESLASCALTFNSASDCSQVVKTDR